MPRHRCRHPIRLICRLVYLGAVLAFVAVEWWRVPRNRQSLRGRAQWMHESARRLARVLNLQPEVHGVVPVSGLLVSNHLSYVDILLLGSLGPMVFVAKSDVAGWPVFGWLTCMAGTVFVNRARRFKAAETARQMEAALAAGVPVVLFPEGTSSDGAQVLPFRSALLGLATQPDVPLHAAHLGYALTEGNVAEEVCYWRDMTLVPHLANLLTKGPIIAKVRLGEWQGQRADRKQLALELREFVAGLG